MCGIAGIIRFDGQPADRDAVGRACLALRHRGPDQHSTWQDQSNGAAVTLGATRLAVLDPRIRGSQPMHRGERYHLVFNGEVYNYRTIRAELEKQGEQFSTDGDTEVVLQALAKWGPDALNRFNGMWALAFYDSVSGEGLLARDRFGIKPLCFVDDASGLRFASEMKALRLITEGQSDIDEHALVHLLQFGYVPDPATILQDVRRLEPGHYLRFVSNSTESPTRFYAKTAAPHGTDDPPPYGEARVMLRRKIADAVTARRVSDVPIGAFLSGGLDSSIMVAELARASGCPIKTFSVGFAGHRSYDETKFARIAAQRFNTDHHEIVLTQQDIIDAIPRLLDHLGEPVGDSSIIPTSLVSYFARSSVTVSLSGDGGDELFGGYWRYLGHSALKTYRRIPAALRKSIIEPVIQRLQSSRSSMVRNRGRQLCKLVRVDAEDMPTSHVAWSRILSDQAASVFRDSGEAQRGTERMIEAIHAMNGDGPLTDDLARILAFDVRYQLPADMLQKVDLASMMHSLEVRVPFLDHSVVEFAESLPISYKVDRGMGKRILIDAYRGEIPDAILDRPKMGFEVPVGELLRGPLRELFCDTVTREAVESFGLLSYEGVMAVYEQHRTRRADHANVLFALLSLCWWWRAAGFGPRGSA